jgi:hypothetical protein
MGAALEIEAELDALGEVIADDAPGSGGARIANNAVDAKKNDCGNEQDLPFEMRIHDFVVDPMMRSFAALRMTT